MYISFILYYLTWPVLIILTYWLVNVLMRKYEKLFNKREEDK